MANGAEVQEPVRLNQTGCARCHGEGHMGMEYLPLAHPVVGPDGTTWTHWAPCPTNGEPILMRRGPLPPIRQVARSAVERIVQEAYRRGRAGAQVPIENISEAVDRLLEQTARG